MLSTSVWYNKKSGKVIETARLSGFDGLTLGECRREIDELIDQYGSIAVVEAQVTSEGEQLIYVSFEREEHSNETAERLNKDKAAASREKAYKTAQYNKLKEELGL